MKYGREAGGGGEQIFTIYFASTWIDRWCAFWKVFLVGWKVAGNVYIEL